MKIPIWFKNLWWLVIVGFFAYLFSQRYYNIMNGSISSTDIIIFLVFIVLLVLPLFQEFSIFGVSFKKEIENLKAEFKEQIINLRSDIQNNINMRTEISPHITIGNPPTDSELPSMEERIRPMLEKVLKEQGIKKPEQTYEPEIPDDTRYLFSVRYAIENEVKRIWRQLKGDDPRERPRTLYEKINELRRSEIMDIDLTPLIRDILAICNQAIHGEDTSQAKIKFVREVAPELIASLKSTTVLPIWLQQGIKNSAQGLKPNKWPPEGA